MAAPPPLAAPSDSPDRTRSLGAALAAVLEAGDVVLLSGDMGAGKTVLVQGIAAGLGVAEAVTSPTFALLHEHQGSVVRLVHADAWRLSSPAEAVDLALAEEVGDGRTVLVVEWGELAAAAVPENHLQVVIESGLSEDDRLLGFVGDGERWQARWASLRAALATAAQGDGAEAGLVARQ